jgi:endonuclease I
MKRFVLKGLITLFFCIPFISGATIPPGYYDNAAGLSGLPLKTALYNIIKGHTSISYDDLYAAYVTTDNLPSNKVWDMYSLKSDGTANYYFTNSANNSDQCGNYSAEGDCYNREHSTPSSWFNDATPMYSDLFNVYPTDGYVNNKRANYPMADVGSTSWTSSNGSKLGACSTSGYSGTVFEPIDSFKGDFARTFFYMATRYENLVSSWPSNAAECAAVYAGNGGVVFKTWYVTMLLSWCDLDPVSTKEINRNDAVYAIQHNRNPYIDHPEWIDAIWGPNAGTQDFSSALINLNIFPVPAKDEINISTGEALYNITLSLYSAEGKFVFEKQFNELLNDYSLDISDAVSGFYFLKIICDEGVEVKKVIVEKP